MLDFRGVHPQTWTSICLFGGWEKRHIPPHMVVFFLDFPWYKVKTTPDLKQIQVESDQDDLKTWDEFENMG